MLWLTTFNGLEHHRCTKQNDCMKMFDNSKAGFKYQALPLLSAIALQESNIVVKPYLAASTVTRTRPAAIPGPGRRRAAARPASDSDSQLSSSLPGVTPVSGELPVRSSPSRARCAGGPGPGPRRRARAMNRPPRRRLRLRVRAESITGIGHRIRVRPALHPDIQVEPSRLNLTRAYRD
jgi:hypothetical protein